MGRWKIFAADVLRIAALAALVLFLMGQFQGSRISDASFEEVARAVVAASGLPGQSTASGLSAQDTVSNTSAADTEEAADSGQAGAEDFAESEPGSESAAAEAPDLNQAPAQPGNNQMIKRLYDLDPEAFDGILLYYPTTNMNAEELLLVKLSGSDAETIRQQQETVTAAIEERRQTQMHTFEGYAPQQYAMLEKSVVDVQGNFILFVSGDFAQRTQKAFEEITAQ